MSGYFALKIISSSIWCWWRRDSQFPTANHIAIQQDKPVTARSNKYPRFIKDRKHLLLLFRSCILPTCSAMERYLARNSIIGYILPVIDTIILVKCLVKRLFHILTNQTNTHS